MKQEIIRCFHKKMLDTQPLKEVDLKKNIQSYCPVPTPFTLAERKYIYFYNPYTLKTNTNKFIKFDDSAPDYTEDSGWNKLRGFFYEADDKLFLFVIN